MDLSTPCKINVFKMLIDISCTRPLHVSSPVAYVNLIA